MSSTSQDTEIEQASISELTLIKDIFTLIEQPSDDFPNAIAEIIRRFYRLFACTFYFRSQSAPDILILRGQNGFSAQEHEKVELSYHYSMAGTALQSNSATLFQDIATNNEYEKNIDFKKLKEKHGVSCMIAIPLNTIESFTELHNISPSPYAALCLYPPGHLNKAQLEKISQSMERIAPFVSDAFLRAVVHDRILIQQDITQSVFTSKDLNSFLHKIVKILQELWHVEAASVYMLDERTQTLKLGNTTGISGDKEKKGNIFIPLKMGKNHILTCYYGRRLLIEASQNDPYQETITLPKRSVLYIPIFQSTQESEEHNGPRVIGVLKCINHVVEPTSKLHDSCAFSFIDENRLTLTADFIGVITQLFWRVMHISEDFERTVHGILNNVLSMRANLTRLEKHGGFDRFLDRKLTYIVPDCKSQLDALKWQVQKFSNREKKETIDIQKIRLLGDVISKALQIAHPLAHYYNVNLNLKEGIDHTQLNKTPNVYADTDLLVTVFRNLIENAIKYSKDTRCAIKIYWEDGHDAINVFIEDNGIGIDAQSVDLIFAEGYRTEMAMRRITSGASAGFGLFQCKAIMREMKGDIQLKSNQNPTIFLLTLPKKHS